MRHVLRRLPTILLPVLALAAILLAREAAASCAPIAGLPVWKASLRLAAVPEGNVLLRYLGHSSFLIESPRGIRAVTDYNGYIRPESPPDIATMNHAHSTHYTDAPEPSIRHVLRGWDTGKGVPSWDVTLEDMHVFNVPTNIRNLFGGGTEFSGNSIFVFETATICIAHLGHLHHTLTQKHLSDLGPIDVLLAPVDGTWTLDLDGMIEVIEQIRPALVVPMHYFTETALQRFLTATGKRWPVRVLQQPETLLSRAQLPRATEVLVLPGGG